MPSCHPCVEDVEPSHGRNVDSRIPAWTRAAQKSCPTRNIHIRFFCEWEITVHMFSPWPFGDCLFYRQTLLTLTNLKIDTGRELQKQLLFLFTFALKTSSLFPDILLFFYYVVQSSQQQPTHAIFHLQAQKSCGLTFKLLKAAVLPSIFPLHDMDLQPCPLTFLLLATWPQSQCHIFRVLLQDTISGMNYYRRV